MNPDTNELRRFSDFKDLYDAINQGFEPVPDNLEFAAKIKLAGKESAIVSRNSGGKLSKWAAKKRRERRKHKQMVAKCNEYYNQK